MMPRTYLKAVKKLKDVDETQKLDKLNFKRMHAYKEALSMLEQIQNMGNQGIYINNVPTKSDQPDQKDDDKYSRNKLKTQETPKPNEDLDVSGPSTNDPNVNNQLLAKKIIYHNQKHREPILNPGNLRQSQGRLSNNSPVQEGFVTNFR